MKSGHANRQKYTKAQAHADKRPKPAPVPEQAYNQASSPTSDSTQPCTTSDDDEGSPTEGEDGDDAAGDEEGDVDVAAAVEVKQTEPFFHHSVEHHRQKHSGGKSKCRGCGGAYRVYTNRALKLCYNCDRLVEAARNNAARLGGYMEVVVEHDDSGAFIKVFCSKGHQRINDFKPRQGQRKCIECAREKMAQEKERIKEEEEKEAQKRAAAQAEMFRQVHSQFDFQTAAAAA